MTHALDLEAWEWMLSGSQMFRGQVSTFSSEAIAAPSGLPGWSRAHVIAHVAANAEALRRLTHWASSGEERLMYASREARDAEIESGSALPSEELLEWLYTSDRQLIEELKALSPESWSALVVTAQGREVPALEILWMRSRETWIHGVDLAGSATFHEMPVSFLERLVFEVCSKFANPDRPTVHVVATDLDKQWVISGGNEDVEVRGSLPDLASWLTGRGSDRIATPSGEPVISLGPWL